jgi:hypothetical protein
MPGIVKDEHRFFKPDSMFSRLLIALFASHSNSIGIIFILIVYTKSIDNYPGIILSTLKKLHIFKAGIVKDVPARAAFSRATCRTGR